jgi:hypothetical protein
MEDERQLDDREKDDRQETADQGEIDDGSTALGIPARAGGGVLCARSDSHLG